MALSSLALGISVLLQGVPASRRTGFEAASKMRRFQGDSSHFVSFCLIRFLREMYRLLALPIYTGVRMLEGPRNIATFCHFSSRRTVVRRGARHPELQLVSIDQN